MAKFFKLVSFILFFLSGYFGLSTILYVMKEQQLEKWFSLLLFNWLIAITLYFVGEFIQRVNRAEDRLNSIIKFNNNCK